MKKYDTIICDVTGSVETQAFHLRQCLKMLRPNGLAYIIERPAVLARIASEFDFDRQRILQWLAPEFYQSVLCVWNSDKRPDIDIDAVRVPYGAAYKKAIGKPRKQSHSARFGSAPSTYGAHQSGAMPRDVIEAKDIKELHSKLLAASIGSDTIIYGHRILRAVPTKYGGESEC